MITRIYAVNDTKATFWKPHVQLNDLVARREFDNMINSGANDFYSINYADLELWYLGEYDDITGIQFGEKKDDFGWSYEIKR